MKSDAERILRRTLGRIDQVGRVRQFLISIFFPEFYDIVGDLAELSDHLEL